LFVIGEVLEARVVPEVPVPVVPISPAPKRGWYQWCDSAAIAVGILIVNEIRYFSKVITFLNSIRATILKTLGKDHVSVC